MPCVPPNSALPSAVVTDRVLAMLLPDLAANPDAVIASPTVSVWRSQPSRVSELGLASSKLQLVVVLSALMTSMKKRACGLVHSIFVTVPLNVTTLFSSYSDENAWCAVRRAPPTAIAPSSRIPIVLIRDLRPHLLKIELRAEAEEPRQQN